MIEDEGKFEVETSKSVEMLKRPLRYSTFAQREQAEGNNLKGGGGSQGKILKSLFPSGSKLIVLMQQDPTEDRSCHRTEWSENILCGGRQLMKWRPPHKWIGWSTNILCGGRHLN